MEDEALPARILAPVGEVYDLNNGQSNQYNLQTTPLRDGGFVVSWEELRQIEYAGDFNSSDRDLDIKAQVFDARGVPLGDPVLLEVDPITRAMNYVALTDADGGATFVFSTTVPPDDQGLVQPNAGVDSLKFIQIDAAGRPGEPQDVPLSQALKDLLTDAAYDVSLQGATRLEGGEFAIALMRMPDEGPDIGNLLLIYDPADAQADVLMIDLGEGLHWGATLSPLSDGGLALHFIPGYTSYDLSVLRIAVDGTLIDAPPLVDGVPPEVFSPPVLETLGNGDFYRGVFDLEALTGDRFQLLWTTGESVGFGPTLIRTYAADGTPESATMALAALADPTIRNIDLVSLEEDGFAVLWGAYQTWDVDIGSDMARFVQRYDTDGAPVGDLLRIPGTDVGAMTALADGSVIVTSRVSQEIVTQDGSISFSSSYEFRRLATFYDFTGTAQADTINGTEDADLITGLGGDDSLIAAGGDDYLNGGGGADTLVGGAGQDTLEGGLGPNDLADRLYGGAGNDHLRGGAGNDALRGDAGDDTLAGGFGADTLIGEAGDDQLSGAALGDLLFGGNGDDFINGGFGFDRLNGGAGADRFFHLGISDHGTDWIQDYSGDVDTLVFGRAATADQFQINSAFTPGAGNADVAEAFVIYKPTGQILWALVDGMGQDQIGLTIDGTLYDLSG